MSSAGRIDELKKRYEENPRRFFAPLANEYRKAGDLDAAIALCQEHLADQPGNMNGHVVYGQALFEAARFDEAQATFETALALDPENLIALRHLGDMARTSGDRLKAREWYSRVLDADPRNEEILGFLREIDESLAAPGSTSGVAPESVAQETDRAQPSVAGDVAGPLALMDALPSSREALGEAKTVEIPPVTPQSSPAVKPSAPMAGPTSPPRQSTGLLDLSIDLGSPVESEFGAGLESSLPKSMPPAASPPADLVGEAFAESFGVLYEEATGSAPPVPREEPPTAGIGHESAGEFSIEPAPTSEAPAAAAAEFSVEAAPDFSFESQPGSFAEPEPEPVDASHPFPEFSIPPAEEAPVVSADGPFAESPNEADAVAPVADLLFGDSPLDVAAAPAPALEAHEETPPLGSRPTPPGGTPGAEQGTDTPQAFVTETMAELYLQQGFRDEALSVYRQLSAQNPGDESLRERVRHLEHGDRSSLSLEALPPEDSAAAGEPSGAPEGFTPIGAMLEPVAATTPTDVPLATARGFFAALSLRRALRSDGTPPLGIDAVTDAGAAARPEDHQYAAGGTLDAMFDAPPPEADERLATVVASMAIGIDVPAPVVKGQPTKPADTELSLDTVFRESTPRSSSAVSRRSQKLRFDQFFTPADEVGTVEASPPPSDPGSPADLEQFSAWLQGLKPK
jgi:tetratricopeptide (TPR) repeat protein